MPGVTKEQLQAARQISLLDYLQQHDPSSLVLRGNEYRSKVHSSLAISRDGSKWHWFKGGVGGRSALDYFVKVEGMPLPDAVNLLVVPNIPAPARRETPPPVASDPPKAFELPLKCKSADRAISYLTGRGIDLDLIQHCIYRGTLYESYPHHNVVFVGYDKAGTAKFASLRGTMPDSKFRMDQPGSDKRYAFRFDPPCCPAQEQRWVAAFESPIDALSFVTLNRMTYDTESRISPVSWDKLPCISLSGTAHIPVIQYLRDHPSIDTLYLGLDNDDGGQKGTLRIKAAIESDPVLSSQVKHIIAIQPSKAYGKDYNELLQAVLQARQPTRATPQKADSR